jgi:hypothetical protein
MSKARVEAASGEIRLRQSRHGEEQCVSFPIEDADTIIAWIRSAKAQLQRLRPAVEVPREATPA